jgi:hypothetical protein
MGASLAFLHAFEGSTVDWPVSLSTVTPTRDKPKHAGKLVVLNAGKCTRAGMMCPLTMVRPIPLGGIASPLVYLIMMGSRVEWAMHEKFCNRLLVDALEKRFCQIATLLKEKGHKHCVEKHFSYLYAIGVNSTVVILFLILDTMERNRTVLSWIVFGHDFL